MKLKLILLLILLPVLCYSQLSTNEVPVSWTSQDVSLQKQIPDIPQIVVSRLDLDKLQQEDLMDEQNGVPPRFGYPEKVTINLEDEGVWQALSDGSRIWRIRIISPDALSINLLYDKFYMPEDGKLFIYATDKGSSIGAFTSKNNKNSSSDGFATGLVFSNDVTVEYYEPLAVKGQGVLSIAYVVSGYRLISEILQEGKFFGSSGSCQVNINCPEGANWQNEKKAVAMILVGGIRLCTGSLINNTSNNTEPYFLTADHCTNYYGDAITSPNLSSFSFYWMYEDPTCVRTSTEPPIYSTSGATIVANNSTSDFSLLRLTEDPINLSSISTYYLGWDCTGAAGIGGVGIHHPMGDVKKISTYTNAPVNSTCINANYWDISFVQTVSGFSVMQPGSSGSSLITSARKVIGQLYGPGYCANIQCENPSAQRVAYGKFSISWHGDNATDPRRRLKDWLDPLNVIPSGGGTWDGLAGGGDCILRIENQTLTSSQTFTNACPVIMRNVTITNGANIVVQAQEYILLESDVEVTSNSSLDLSLF